MKTLQALAVLLSFAFACGEAIAAADPNAGFDLGGSFKSIFAYQRLRQRGLAATDHFPYTEQRLRPTAVVTQSAFRFEAAHELAFFLQDKPTTVVPIPDFTPTSAWPATKTIFDNGSTYLTSRLDRFFVQFSKGDIELRVGKQVIDTGVGRLFNAVSQVPRYPFAFIDTEFVKTEDAVSLVWKGSLTLESRYLPKVRGQQRDSFHVRAKAGKDGYDIALTAGRSDDKPYGGLEIAGNVGDSLLRAELVGYEWLGRQVAQALVGWDEAISPTFSIQVEAFHNGFGNGNGYRLDPLAHRSVPFRGRWYLGAVANWELSPRWTGVFSAVANLGDPSVLANLVFRCSLMNNVELVLGQYIGVRSREDSEFGGRLALPGPGLASTIAVGLPDITYAELKYYF